MINNQDVGGVAVGRVDPEVAWRGLNEDPTSCLIDVRTREEWTFVGGPDLSQLNRNVWMIEWRSFPQMVVNEHFNEAFKEKFAAATPRNVYFICRSGARSFEAAQSAMRTVDTPQVAFFNVEEGFEGDLDENRQRGRLNGWKARGLPWLQN